jgi:hypothetical protein
MAEYSSQMDLFPSLGETPTKTVKVLVVETPDDDEDVGPSVDDDNNSHVHTLVEERSPSLVRASSKRERFMEQPQPTYLMSADLHGLPKVTVAWSRWFAYEIMRADADFDECDIPDVSAAAVAFEFMNRCECGTLSLELRTAAAVLTNRLLFFGVNIGNLVALPEEISKPPRDFDWQRGVNREYMLAYARAALCQFTLDALSDSSAPLASSDVPLAPVGICADDFVFTREHYAHYARKVHNRTVALANGSVFNTDGFGDDVFIVVLYLYMKRKNYLNMFPEMHLVQALTAWYSVACSVAKYDVINATVLRVATPSTKDPVAWQQQVDDFVDNTLYDFVCVTKSH